MLEKATFAGGCFWCTEAIFCRLKGVSEVTPGYTGGSTPSPSYEQVCSGQTGHAEAIELKFDPAIISYQTLLSVFFALHDPTTLNRQGADVGSQYRSAIFYHTPSQKSLAFLAKQKLPHAVTEIVSATKFYPAELSHQQYYELNPDSGYCRFVIAPKLHKLLETYTLEVDPKYR